MKTTLLAGIASLALVMPALAQTTTSPGQSQPQTTPPSMNRSTGTGTTDTTTSTGRPAVQSPSTAQSPSSVQSPSTAQSPSTTTTITPNVTQSQSTTTAPGTTGTQMTYMNGLTPGHFMASNLMDRTVYGADGNSLGDINDVIIDRNGNIAAVVIGVGGFLGIGEKDVAVPFNRLQVMGRDQARAPGATNTAPGTSGMAGSTTTTTGTTGMAGGDGFWGSFNDESRIVLSATRDELRGAPTFRESARSGTARTGTGGTATTPNTTAPGGTPTR